ncbi:unnamed protein product [Brachionus calyciflorus]|uniref:Uncharacterized protein n=1 Tax=Brachionus calyciflorus TaxID=104777 RepID=A0A814LQU0_9BILA|nr:unnamed protein product [Brachionus calyciflorus]
MSARNKFNINDFPSEILALILAKISGKELLKSVVFTCKKWHKIIDSESFWTYKISNEKKATHELIKFLIENDLYEPKKLYFKNPYGRNLIKNACAEKGFYAWDLKPCIEFSNDVRIASYYSDEEYESNDENYHENYNENYDENKLPSKNLFNSYEKHFSKDENIESELRGFRIETESNGGVQAVDQYSKPINNYATTYYMCAKYQLIDLYREGVDQEAIEKLRPRIEIEDFYAPRNDCGSKYYVQAVLFDQNFRPLDSAYFNDQFPQWSDCTWKKFTHVFKDYSSDVRYILFQHGGKDTQFWAGHYGIKVTNSAVRLNIF